MADFVSSFDNLMIKSAASSSSSSAVDGSLEEICSICLDPYTTDDPSTVTGCKHEYHLQCILDWLQRSNECPICGQDLALQDPSIQELLSAVGNERALRTRRSAPNRHPILHNFYEYPDIDHDDSYSYETDFDDEEDQTHTSSEEGDSSNSISHATGTAETPLSADSPVGNSVPVVPVNQDSPFKIRFLCNDLPPDNPQSSSQNELSFSESMKLKLSAASSRCKESISKGTQGFKEKLLARNTSVKELSKGAQREMNVGIAGFTKVLERLDLTLPKRFGSSVSDSTCTERTSNISFKGKSVHNGNDVDDPHAISYTTIPGRVEVYPSQKTGQRSLGGD